MRGLGLLAAAVLLGGGLLSGPSAAADGDEPGRRAEPLETRWISVRALTWAYQDFIPDRGPSPALPSDVNDEARPLFGGESEEGVRPYGTIDTVIELVKKRSAPKPWDGEGAAIAASGNAWLVVRAPKALLDATSAIVADLEKEALVLVTVDVLALEGDAAAAAGERGVEAGLQSGALRLVAAVRACAHPGQRASVLSGGERAYLQDQDVEVAEDATGTDPIVGVLNEGLCVSVRPVLSGDAVRLDVQAWLARLESLEPRHTAQGEIVEVPTLRVHEATSFMLKATADAWTYLAAGKDLGFAVRASVRRPPATPAGTTLPVLPHKGPLGPIESTTIDASDLVAHNTPTRAGRQFLTPSNFTPPEEPELPEPARLFPEEALVDTVKTTVDPESWETEGTSLEIENRRLTARTDATHAAAIRDLVEILRKTFVRSCRVKATVVSLPLAAFPELVAGVDDGAALLADGGTALLAREGVRIEDRASVRFPRGGRAGAEQGTAHRYLGDYDIEIAQKAMIGNPRVFTALEGLSLDVAGDTTADGTALAMEVRMDRSIWREVRRVKTRHGDLDCPYTGMTRIRGSLVVPVGATRLAGVSVEGGRATLVLLTALAE